LLDFPDVPNVARPTDPMSGDFWLGYWIRAYSALLKSDPGLHFLAFDRLCADPLPSIEAVSALLEVPDAFALLKQETAVFRPATRYDLEALRLAPALAARAREVEAQLLARAINGAALEGTRQNRAAAV